ncbi:MAG TPA: 6-phosphogluconolactonase [Rubricoccaceae bacterium]|jgi:6-phosphogluconolactonase
MSIVILPTAADVSDALADRTADRLRAVLGTRARATLCLTGGSTPEPAYARLAAAEGIEWDRVHLFWGDERAVGPDSPDSNAGMAQRTLIGPARIPASNVRRIEGERGAAEAARRYEACLEEFFGAAPARFDVLHLGMGPDGHVASLFPGSPALAEQNRRVVATEAPDGMAVRDRITLTLPVLGRSALTLIAATGAGKRDALAAVFSTDPPPAGRVRPENGELTWLLDAALADGIAEATDGPGDGPAAG